MSKSHVANKNIGCFQLYPLLYPAIRSRDISAAFASKISPIFYNKKHFIFYHLSGGRGGGGGGGGCLYNKKIGTFKNSD